MNDELVVNVCTNVLNIFLALLASYAAMYTLENIFKFAASAFSGVKVFSEFKHKKFRL